jgi:uncharacterized membrane protein YecN with MAPEG domain
MITSLYAGLLGILFFIISIQVIIGRRSHKISLGPGPNNEIGKLVSAHANFTSYAIFLIVLLGFLEYQELFPEWVIHTFGCLFTLGRILHFKAFASGKMNFPIRKFGMHLTLWPLLLLGILLVYSYFA